MDAVEYGLISGRDDEREIVKNVNAFLATKQYRKMKKEKDQGGIRNINDPDSDPKIEYRYVQFIKDHPRWYFSIEPNVDLREIHRFPDHPECAWTLWYSKTRSEMNSEADNQYLDQFLSELIRGTGFDCVLLHAYKDADYRR